MKRLILFFLLSFLSISSYSQELKRILLDKETPINFIGVDFSRAKMVGSHKFKPAKELITNYIPYWNYLFQTREKKYEVPKLLRKRNVSYSFENLERFNSEVNPEELVTNVSAKEFTVKDIEEIVSKYRIKSDISVALVLIVNSFNKISERANVSVVYLNSKTNKILYSYNESVSPRGRGLRDYWMGALHNVFLKIYKERYKEWKKSYR